MTTVTGSVVDIAGEVVPGGRFEVGLAVPDVGDALVVTTRRPVQPDDEGAFEFDVPGGQYVTVRPVNLRGLTEWVFLIPDVESVGIGELIADHLINPETLQPTLPTPTLLDVISTHVDEYLAEHPPGTLVPDPDNPGLYMIGG